MLPIALTPATKIIAGFICSTILHEIGPAKIDINITFRR